MFLFVEVHFLLCLYHTPWKGFLQDGIPDKIIALFLCKWEKSRNFTVLSLTLSGFRDKLIVLGLKFQPQFFAGALRADYTHAVDSVIAEGFGGSRGFSVSKKALGATWRSEKPAHRFRNGHRLPGGKHGRPVLIRTGGSGSAGGAAFTGLRRGSARRASSKAANGVFGANISTRKSGSANSQTIFRSSRY